MSKCILCLNDSYLYELCKECIVKNVRVCTCNKTFITGKPQMMRILDKTYDIPDPIPDYFFLKLQENYYHILGCRGCEAKEEISVQNNFEKALQASIVSCVYQHIDNKWTYLSDSLDEVFEKYLESKGIKVGEPTDITFEFVQ